MKWAESNLNSLFNILTQLLNPDGAKFNVKLFSLQNLSWCTLKTCAVVKYLFATTVWRLQV